jgi:hypothetical protein
MVMDALSSVSPRVLRLDPAGSERNQLGHGLEIELLFNASAMGIDGLCAQMKFLRDLGDTVAAADQLEDLKLAVAQPLGDKTLALPAATFLTTRADISGRR